MRFDFFFNLNNVLYNLFFSVYLKIVSHLLGKKKYYFLWTNLKCSRPFTFRNKFILSNEGLEKKIGGHLDLFYLDHKKLVHKYTCVKRSSSSMNLQLGRRFTRSSVWIWAAVKRVSRQRGNTYSGTNDRPQCAVCNAGCIIWYSMPEFILWMLLYYVAKNSPLFPQSRVPLFFIIILT